MSGEGEGGKEQAVPPRAGKWFLAPLVFFRLLMWADQR